MRRTASEKMEIIRLVEGTDLPVRLTLRQMGVPRSTFYDWYQRYAEEGFDGLLVVKPIESIIEIPLIPAVERASRHAQLA